jgi:hypothetical protein
MVVHPSYLTWEAETRGSLIGGQTGLHSETQSQQSQTKQNKGGSQEVTCCHPSWFGDVSWIFMEHKSKSSITFRACHKDSKWSENLKHNTFCTYLFSIIFTFFFFLLILHHNFSICSFLLSLLSIHFRNRIE